MCNPSHVHFLVMCCDAAAYVSGAGPQVLRPDLQLSAIPYALLATKHL